MKMNRKLDPVRNDSYTLANYAVDSCARHGVLDNSMDIPRELRIYQLPGILARQRAKTLRERAAFHRRVATELRQQILKAVQHSRRLLDERSIAC